MFLRKSPCNLLLKNWNHPGLDICKSKILPDRRSCIELNTQMLQIKCMVKYGYGDVLLFWSELKLITFYNCFLYTLVCLSYSTFKLKNSRPHLHCSVIISCWVYYRFCGRYAKNDFQTTKIQFNTWFNFDHYSCTISFSQVRKSDKVNKKMCLVVPGHGLNRLTTRWAPNTSYK